MLTAFLVAGVMSLPPAPHCPAGTRYFFILFGGEALPLKPRTAHTWATFVKVTPCPTGELAIEAHTISWLPADANVRVLRLRAVQGRNFSLDETFAINEAEGARMSRWGPYEIDAERYNRAADQVRRLDGGEVRYRVFDSLGRNHTICHCVHAVTYADPVMQRRLQPVLQIGERGTSRLAAKYERAGTFPFGTATHEWVRRG